MKTAFSITIFKRALFGASILLLLAAIWLERRSYRIADLRYWIYTQWDGAHVRTYRRVAACMRGEIVITNIEKVVDRGPPVSLYLKDAYPPGKHVETYHQELASLSATVDSEIPSFFLGFGFRASEPMDSDHSRAIAVIFPIWCFMAPGASLVLWHLLKRGKRAVRRRSGRCAQCGYDLRATRERCPECGTVTRTH